MLAALSLVLAYAGPVRWSAAIADLERRSGGRMGVYVANVATGREWGYRSTERFRMCSTGKLLVAGAVLRAAERRAYRLDDPLELRATDVVSHSPELERFLKRGTATVEELCRAMLEVSDNGAANVLFRKLGGPAGITASVRRLGDVRTGFDRYEPDLNTGDDHDLRDTTTPAAFGKDLRRLLLGTGLLPASKERLLSWMAGSRTGLSLLRAGIPGTWRMVDKSGTGGRSNWFGDSEVRNDVAVVWPVQGGPLVVTVFLSGSQLRARERDATLASVGRLLSKGLGLLPSHAGSWPSSRRARH